MLKSVAINLFFINYREEAIEFIIVKAVPKAITSKFRVLYIASHIWPVMNDYWVAISYCRRRVRRIPTIWLLSVFLITAYYGFYKSSSVEQEFDKTNVIAVFEARKTKTVLIWDTRNHIDFEVLVDENRLGRCRVNDCQFTKERTLTALHKADAVIFNAPPLTIKDFPIDPHRRPEQRYIFASPEPPVLFAEQINKFNNYFNWTMSYRRDSDIPYLYGDVQRRSSLSTVNQKADDAVHGKTKLVAWFVSHCFTQSRREAYIEQLRQHVTVDVYGNCYNETLKCAQNSTTHLSDDSCYEMLERDYKFYLAFENSLCKDYVTEKFFKILQRRIVPVVLGEADYSQIAPPRSFIDARRYSPEGLASYLKRVAANDTLYNNFFQWKNHYVVSTRYPDIAERTLCRLCERLHTDRSHVVYNDLRSQWSTKTDCVRPRYKNLPLVFGVF